MWQGCGNECVEFSAAGARARGRMRAGCKTFLLHLGVDYYYDIYAFTQGSTTPTLLPSFI